MTQEEFEHIEQFLSGSLAGEALAVFEKRMTSDSQFAKQVEEQRLLQDAIEEDGLRNTLNQIHESIAAENTEAESPKVISLKPWMRYAAAACIALLIGWGGFTFFGESGLGNTDSNEQLFATHFKPDPGLPTTMSVADNFNFFDAMVSYKQGDYTKAITKWETLLKEKPKNDTLNYFLGVAYLANNNEEQAITFLQWASEHPESSFSKEIYHYLGLANIKKGDLNKAKQNLELSTLPESEKLLKAMQ